MFACSHRADGAEQEESASVCEYVLQFTVKFEASFSNEFQELLIRLENLYKLSLKHSERSAASFTKNKSLAEVLYSWPNIMFNENESNATAERIQLYFVHTYSTQVTPCMIFLKWDWQ